MEEFIKSWCSESENYDADHVSDTPTMSNFDDFLDGVDKIDLGGLRNTCLCLADFFENSYFDENSEGTYDDNWMCNFLSSLNDNSAVSQTFETSPDNGFHTKVIKKEGKYIMQISQGACDGTLLDKDDYPVSSTAIGAMFIHEFLHTHFEVLANEVFKGNTPLDLFTLVPTDDPSIFNKEYKPEYYQKVYENWIPTYTGPSGNKHEAFFIYLAGPLITSLQNLNGGAGTPTDYLYYFHLLMNTQGMYEVLGIENFDINTYLPQWESIGGNMDGFGGLFDSGC